MDELMQARVLSELMKNVVGSGVEYPIPKIQSTLPYLTEEDIKGVMYDLKASGVITIISGDNTICTVIIQSRVRNYLGGGVATKGNGLWRGRIVPHLGNGVGACRNMDGDIESQHCDNRYGRYE